MTTPTIDLRRGLEALYYFDERYFDGGANELKDRSGNRSPMAPSGGPTIGVAGPKSYDAASLDGTDDIFTGENSDRYSIPLSGALTVSAVFRVDAFPRSVMTVIGNQTSGGAGSQNGWRVYVDEDDIGRADVMMAVEDSDGNGATATLAASQPVKKWLAVSVTYDLENGIVWGTYNGNPGVNTADVSGFTADVTGAAALTIGERPGVSDYLEGTVAFAQVNSRAL